MEQPSNEQIRSTLIGIISDGFDRSLNALAKAGMIDLSKLHQHYSGAGSAGYDLVTAQIELTAQTGVDRIRSLYSSELRTDITSGPTTE